MNPAQALLELQNNAPQFLKYYPLNPAGINQGLTANQANSRQFHIFRKPAVGAAKEGHFGAARPGRVLAFRSHDISSFNIAATAFYPGGAVFQALAVPMVYYDEIVTLTAMDAYLLDNSRTLMITGQPFELLLLHGTLSRRPGLRARESSGSLGPEDLQSELAVNGAFANYPGRFLTFGRQNYPGYAAIFGVRT